MADESHDFSEMAKVPGSFASTSSSFDNVNLGTQRDVVTGGVDGDFIKEVGRDFIKEVGRDLYTGCHFSHGEKKIGRPFSIMSSDFEAFKSTKQDMVELMKALQNDKVAAIGVYGLGGIGKTSMVKHVSVQAQIFHPVIMAVVSQSPELRKIQDSLADLLGFKFEEQTEIGRAARLMEKIMSGNKTLIILDDIWERIELSSIGIPCYNDLQRCNSKVLLTTRRLSVCHSMETQANIPLNILSEEDSWNLFLKKARKSFQKSTDFYDVARKVARGCAGLPGVLKEVAMKLGDKDFEEWKEAAQRLEMSQCANRFLLEEKDMLKRIKLSYDGKVAVGASFSATAGNNSSWLSPSGDFAFGFRQLENGDHFLLCIWFAKIPDRTIVWYANGDRPAPKGSYVELTAKSGLVLKSPQGEQLWKSYQTIAGVVAHGVMNDKGNLVLEDDKSESLWETFKNPTDTMLPGQIIERGGKLSSRQSETNYAKGRFQVVFQQDGNLVFSAEKPFYSTRTTTGTVSGSEGKQLVFNDSGNFYILRVNSGIFTFTAEELPAPAIDYYFRSTLNSDGVLAQYFLPKSFVGNVSWKALWSEPKS